MCWHFELGSAGQFFKCPLGLFLCLWSVVCQLCWSWLGCLTYVGLIWDDPSVFYSVFFVVSLGFVHIVEARGPVYKQKQIDFLRCKFGSGTTFFCCTYWFKASHRTRESEEVVSQTPLLKEKSDKVSLCSTNLIPRCGHREEKMMTAISAINEHYALKVLPPFCVCIELARIYSHIMPHSKEVLEKGKV